MMQPLPYEFYHRPCLEVAQDLVGKCLVRARDGNIVRMRITQTEAYCGEADTACHAHRGRTKRTEVLYAPAGTIYVYLCYGVHNLLNIVTGEQEEPQAVLIRACEGAEGPGRLTKAMGITLALNRRSILGGDGLWIEDDGSRYALLRARRVGIGYAAEEDQARLWRFVMGERIR